MRASIRDAVVLKHRGLLGQRIRNLELILTGRAPIIVPTIAEEARFRADLREDDLVERALTELLPRIWRLPGTSTRRPRLVAETRVLVELRSIAATLATALDLGGAPEHDDRRAMATALFRYVEKALTPFEFDDAELLPGAAAQYERIVAYALFGQRWGSI